MAGEYIYIDPRIPRAESSGIASRRAVNAVGPFGLTRTASMPAGEMFGVGEAARAEAERAALEARLKEEVYARMREDYLRQRLGVPTEQERAIQEKAAFDAANFEKRYTAQQKAKISQLKQAQNDLQNNPNFSENEKIAASKAIDLQIMGVQPSDLPKLSPYPDGQGTPDIWDAGNGVIVGGRDDNGRPVQFDWGKTAAGQKATHEAEIEKEKMRMRMQLFSRPVTDELGNPVQRQPEDVEKIISQIFKEPAPPISMEQLQAMKSQGFGQPQQQQEQVSPTQNQDIYQQFNMEYQSMKPGQVYRAPDGTWRKKGE
jgi:hypothetical protein